MPARKTKEGAVLSIFITYPLSHGSRTSYSTWGSSPLTPKRVKLLQQLAGSARWKRQQPQLDSTWNEVEEFITKGPPK
jgi:hypothetical protein